MNPRRKTVLKWLIAVFVLLVVLAILFPCTNCQGETARKTITKDRLDNLATALRAYHAEYGKYPPGDGRAVVAALMEENPRRILFLGLGAKAINSAGEPLDAWKTPLRFVRASDDVPPQITSAGRDKIFGTKDDMVADGR
jgi:Type II secretion system (T2SS), protein G